MPKPARIFLIRHGQSQSNVDVLARSTTPDHKIPLTDFGHKQAFEVGEKLRSIIGGERVAFYVSPFLRTRQTAQGVISAFEHSQVERVREDPQIREQEWGNYYEDAEFAKIEKERIRHGIFFYRLPGGESGADVFTRGALFLDTFHRDFLPNPDYPQNVVIVSHGLTIRLLLMRWLHWTVEEFENTRNPFNCQFFQLNLNDAGHYQLAEPFPQRTPEPIIPTKSFRGIPPEYQLR